MLQYNRLFHFRIVIKTEFISGIMGNNKRIIGRLSWINFSSIIGKSLIQSLFKHACFKSILLQLYKSL